MSGSDGVRLDSVAEACTRHAERMRSAMQALDAVMPVGGQDLQQLADEDIRGFHDGCS